MLQSQLMCRQHKIEDGPRTPIQNHIIFPDGDSALRVGNVLIFKYLIGLIQTVTYAVHSSLVSLAAWLFVVLQHHDFYSSCLGPTKTQQG